MDEWNGKFELVDPKLVVVDHRYQRTEKENLIAKIASSPDWAAFGALSCYQREGVLVCVDGQQRLAGVLQSETPPKKVPAVIFDKATLDKEAQTFTKINVNRTQLSALEKHRGLVVAKNPAALAVERAADKAGFTLQPSTGSTRNIQAIGAVYNAYNLLGEDGLLQVLVQLRDAWPGETSALTVNIIRGVTDVMIDLGSDYNRAKLTNSLAKATPGAIMRKAEELRFDTGGSKQKNVRRAIKALCKV